MPGQAFLRGTQSTASDGRVEFRTIYPSWYRGRTPHLHFKIFVDRTEVVASQAFLREGTQGAVCTVEQHGDSYSSHLVAAVRRA